MSALLASPARPTVGLLADRAELALMLKRKDNAVSTPLWESIQPEEHVFSSGVIELEESHEPFSRWGINE